MPRNKAIFIFQGSQQKTFLFLRLKTRERREKFVGELNLFVMEFLLLFGYGNLSLLSLNFWAKMIKF